MPMKEKVEVIKTANDKFMSKMNSLRDIVERISSPDGTKNSPARTCRDIHAYHPNKPSGLYWIDPNMGCASDAIQVTCKFEHSVAMTCVSAKSDADNMAVPMNSWSRKMSAARKWFHADHKLAEMTYEADKSQLTYLSYLSSEAFQTVTIHCENQAVWNTTSGNVDKAIHFMGMKRTEFTPLVEKRIMHEVISDECRHKRSSPAKTVLKFTNKKFVRLPIVDMAPVFNADSSARFGIELDPVCFV